MNLHEAANKYTPNQDAIMAVLQENLPEEGGYFIPGIPPNTSKADHERLMKEAEGKPWATIQYHKSMETNMVTNIINESEKINNQNIEKDSIHNQIPTTNH
ncbi:MAG: hypothetical protein ACXWFZ_05310 [Nitrososphaeraceae archaeon]